MTVPFKVSFAKRSKQSKPYAPNQYTFVWRYFYDTKVWIVHYRCRIFLDKTDETDCGYINQHYPIENYDKIKYYYHCC